MPTVTQSTGLQPDSHIREKKTKANNEELQLQDFPPPKNLEEVTHSFSPAGIYHFSFLIFNSPLPAGMLILNYYIVN